MQIIELEATYFASYKKLAISLEADKGVVCVEGPNGSGKSTFCDLPCWCLFGRTAKGGAVDEVRNWSSREPTVGRVLLSLPDGRWEVVRKRGSQNDLYFRREGSEDLSRGKDLNDTQRLLNEKLGLDFDLYVAGAYYHEFSQVAQFFTTTAKNRRQICEQLVDLSLAVDLKEKIKDETKEINEVLDTVSVELRTAESSLRNLESSQVRERTRAADWDRERDGRLQAAARSYDAFEKSRRRTVGGGQCPACKRPLGECKEVFNDSPNPYTSLIESIPAEVNPYTGEVRTFQAEINGKRAEIIGLKEAQAGLKTDLQDLQGLSEIIDAYRASSIQNTIRFAEQRTNHFLETSFDGEIRVAFDVKAADKVEVTITKDGNTATFTQLSKGQRQMLKLAFGVASMQAMQNHHGVTIPQLFFDEATDGFRDDNKLKAMRMLGTLTLDYPTIYLVEHSGLVQYMCDDRYKVELVNGESFIGKA